MDYKSKRWKQKREKILRRDNYMCQLSLRYGRRIEANTVHHIFPSEHFPEYEWQDWNLIAVSNEVHNSLHDRETHELTAEGRKLLERTARREGISLEKIFY